MALGLRPNGQAPSGSASHALAVDGRLVQIGIIEDSKITLDLFQMMVRRQTITGSTLRARSVADKAVIARSVHESVVPHRGGSE